MSGDDPTLRADVLIENAAQLVTCAGDTPYHLGLLENACLAISGETVAAVGRRSEVEDVVDCDHALVIDAHDQVVAPGFVDCHTHLVFGGSRVDEYAARTTTDDAAALARMGIKTGILATVEQTRDAPAPELLEGVAARLARMLTAGTTTVESKSGYGLSMAAELKLLETNQLLSGGSPVDVVSTCLGAHGVPAGVKRGDYLRLVIEEMIPRVAELGLAQFADVWCDEGYYTAGESGEVLGAAREAGLEPKIHTDAYSYIGGSDLAADMEMVSADHLNLTPRAVMSRLAKAHVVGVVMPALDFAVRHPNPFDVRAMLDEGMTVALATDLCPACWTESMQFVLALACRTYRMSPAEAVWAATKGGALALGLGDRGSLQAGKLADLQIWDVPRYEHVVYRLGGNVVDKVIKKGKVVVDRQRGCGARAGGLASQGR